jgi:hypothetical protein
MRRGRSQSGAIATQATPFGARLTSPVAELAIESFFPADAETEEALRSLDLNRG